MDLSQITTLILTCNEKQNIERTLKALSWAKQLLIVDSYSTDETAEIAQRAHPNVSIVRRSFDSFAGQCNFGLSLVRTEWVLSLDADYVLTAELAGEVARLNPLSDVAGYSSEFQYCIFGHPLRSTIYPRRIVLYRRHLAKYRDEGHGHRVIVDGKVQRLRGKINHDDRKPLGHWIRSQDQYAITEARYLLSEPIKQLTFKDRLRRKIFFAPVAIFFYVLFGKGLVFDGWPGWYYTFQRTVAELILALRLLEQKLSGKYR